MAAQGELERRQRSEHTKRGMRHAASLGYYMSPRAPYGFRKVPVEDGGRRHFTLELDPQRSPIVQRIYETLPPLPHTGIPGTQSRRHRKAPNYGLQIHRQRRVEQRTECPPGLELHRHCCTNPLREENRSLRRFSLRDFTRVSRTNGLRPLRGDGNVDNAQQFSVQHWRPACTPSRRPP